MNTTPDDYYYKPETESFLRIFAENALLPRQRLLENEDNIFTKQVRAGHTLPANDTYGFSNLHPVTIASKLIERRNFSDAEKQKLHEILSKSFPKDSSGLYAKHTMPVIVGLAHLHALEHKQVPVCLVEGDFRNMGACNSLVDGGLGKNATDKLIYQICDIFKKKFANAADGKNIEVQGVRAGGDEVRFILYGLKPEEVQKILDEKVHPEVNALAAQCGVHALKHFKKDKFPGFGASFGVVNLADYTSVSDLRRDLNKKIEHQKVLDGMLCLGMTDPEGVKRYEDEVFRPALEEQYYQNFAKNTSAHGRVISSRARKEIKAIVDDIVTQAHPEHITIMNQNRDRWEKLARADTIYRGHGDENPRRYFDRLQLEEEQRHLLIRNMGKQADPEPAPLNIPVPAKIKGIEDRRHREESKIPFWTQDADISHKDESPEATRLRAAFKAFGFNEIDTVDMPFLWNQEERKFTLSPQVKTPREKQELQKMVLDLMHVFDAPDSATRCKSALRTPDDAWILAQRHGGVKVVNFELKNLSGLNKVNYDLANAVLRQIGIIINQELAIVNKKVKSAEGHVSYSAKYVHDDQNGKFKVLLPMNFPDDKIIEFRKNVSSRFQNEIGDKQILAFAGDTIAFKPPAPNSDSSEALRAWQNRLDESGRRIEVMKKAIEEQFPADDHEPKMSDIPHPSGKKIALGIKSYVFKVERDENFSHIARMRADEREWEETISAIKAYQKGGAAI